MVKAVLKPVKGTDGVTKEVRPLLSLSTSFAWSEVLMVNLLQAWRKLDPAAGPGGVPAGMVLGLEVYDPRLSCVHLLPLPSSRCTS